MGTFKDPPQNFQELIEQTPEFVPHVVKNFLHYSTAVSQEDNYNTFEADYEEYLQETYLWLMGLHPDSIHRARGCVDKIQTYDESLCPPGMTVRKHFKKFLTEIICRFLNTYRTKRHRDAMERNLEPLEPKTIVVMQDPTRGLLIDECMECLADSVEERDGYLRIKKGRAQPLAKHFGFHQSRERESFRNRVERFVKFHFSSINSQE